MGEYIRREDVYFAIDNYVGGENSIVAVIAKEIRKEVFMLPAADVVERKTGAWVETYGKYGNFRHQCSECGEMFGMPFDFEGKYYPYNYCPNCGADLREEN